LELISLEVRYTEEDFDLESPLGRLKFFDRLYNSPSAFPPGDRITGIKEHLAKLKEHVDTKILDRFTKMEKTAGPHPPPRQSISFPSSSPPL